jgi:streptogramin lyase
MDGTITEYPVPTANAIPHDIALGPDGAMWFTESAGNRVGRITMNGTVTEFVMPKPSRQPDGIAAGPDGAMWFTQWQGNAIGRIAMDGSITEYSVPTAAAGPYLIAAGPDGAMWFTEFQGEKIGRITMKGDITEFSTPSAAAVPAGIAVGTDGAMWFAEQGTSWISKVGTGKGRLLTTSVKGRSTVGSRLTCSSANASPWNVASTARVWLRDGVPIPGATRRTYRLRIEDDGSLITCQASVTFSSTLIQLGAKAKPNRVS